jgi:hypothetical protein
MLRFFPAANSNEQPVLIMTNEDKTACAWCLDEAGLPKGEVSHGICTRHAGDMLAKLAERRAERAKHRH